MELCKTFFLAFRQDLGCRCCAFCVFLDCAGEHAR